jgi:hypothetical protein
MALLMHFSRHLVGTSPTHKGVSMKKESKVFGVFVLSSACLWAVGAQAGPALPAPEGQGQQQQPIGQESVKDLPNVLVISMPEAQPHQNEQSPQQDQGRVEAQAEPQVLFLRIDELPTTQSGDVDVDQLSQRVEQQRANGISMPMQDLTNGTLADNDCPAEVQSYFDQANQNAPTDKVRWGNLAWHFFRDVLDNDHPRVRGFYGYGYRPGYIYRDSNYRRYEPRYGWYDRGHFYNYNHGYRHVRRWNSKGWSNDYYYYGNW